MPEDFILITGDKAIFKPGFSPALVVVQPGTMQGSASASLGNKKICIDGDEKKVTVPGCLYDNANFKAGSGTLTIEELGGDQKSKKTKVDDKPALIKGKVFKAKFTVNIKAVDPSSGAQDPNPFYFGTGNFETTNNKWTTT